MEGEEEKSEKRMWEGFVDGGRSLAKKPEHPLAIGKAKRMNSPRRASGKEGSLLHLSSVGPISLSNYSTVRWYSHIVFSHCVCSNLL